MYCQKQPSAGVLTKSCSEYMQQIYRRTTVSKCDFNKVSKGEDSLWNVSFRAFHEMRISRFHRVNYREMFRIYFLNPFMKYENSENRFSEFSVPWKTFLLNLFSCLINFFIVSDVCENLKENVNMKEKANSKWFFVF